MESWLKEFLKNPSIRKEDGWEKEIHDSVFEIDDLYINISDSFKKKLRIVKYPNGENKVTIFYTTMILPEYKYLARLFDRKIHLVESLEEVSSIFIENSIFYAKSTDYTVEAKEND